MNYKITYDAIIERAKPRGLNKKILEGYFEKHHITPKCIGGLDIITNMVLLTAREHYICHLLVKIHPDDYSLICAFKMMLRSSDKHYRYDKISSTQYEIIKRRHSKISSETIRARIVSDETKKKISKSMTGKIASFETKQKLSNMKKGIMHSDEWNENVSKAMTGKKRGSYKTKLKT